MMKEVRRLKELVRIYDEESIGYVRVKGLRKVYDFILFMLYR